MPPIATEAAEDPGSQAGCVDAARPRRRRILLADDHPICRLEVQCLLEPLEVDLELAGDGSEAVERFVAGRFDLVLMDIDMPVMDGLAAIRRIRAHERASGAAPTPIVTYTGGACAQVRNAAQEAGAGAHLAKPLCPHELIALIEGVPDAEL